MWKTSKVNKSDLSNGVRIVKYIPYRGNNPPLPKRIRAFNKKVFLP